MAFWNNNAGQWFRNMISPALWSATRQQFAADVIDNAAFLRSAAGVFLRGWSDPQVQQENDAGFAIEVVGSTATGSSGVYRILADQDDYSGTNIAHGFLNRFVTVMGSFMFLDAPANALPGGENEGLLISNLLGNDGGAVKPIFGSWYTGGGLTRPVDGASTRAFQKSGAYGGEAHSYDVALFAGAEGSQDEGRLMLFENADHGLAFHFVLFCGPRCEYVAG